MRIFLLCSIILSFLSCGDTQQLGNCIQNNIAPISVNLSLPAYNQLTVPSGHATADGGLKGILLYNKGTSSSQFSTYIAIDRNCPNYDCNTAMTINIPFLECPCDGNKYSVLNGALESGEGDCNARLYNVSQSGNSLQISN